MKSKLFSTNFIFKEEETKRRLLLWTGMNSMAILTLFNRLCVHSVRLRQCGE